MLILPAVDILEGQCVRLTQGDYAAKKIYDPDPLNVALRFQAEGAQMLHVVDLDGARDGEPKNISLILKMAKTLKIPIEVGGGIRNLETVQDYLDGGVKRVILGTQAVLDPSFLKVCLAKFGEERIVVGLDARDGKVVTHGWMTASEKEYLNFARELKSFGVVHLIFTDVSRDGTLTKPAFHGIGELVSLGLEVIASGGISDPESVEELRRLGVSGAILGKALYEKKITLARALLAAQFPSNLTKRIIPCLDVKDGRVVKGVGFVNLQDAGDPVELGKRYSDENADELVFLDITASYENRDTTVRLVSDVAKKVFIPLTVGGGIKSVDEVRRLLHHGADKVSLNTSAVVNPSLVQEASRAFGAQCVVVAIDAKRVGETYKVFVKGGHEETSLEAVSWARKAETLGAGEILLTSMDRDGTKQGYDLELLRKITEKVQIPVIASGGAGSLGDLKEALMEGGADAVLAAGLFHRNEISIRQAKEYLRKEGLPIR